MRLVPLVAVSVLMASSVSACVVAEDLRKGVAVTYADGRTELHRRGAAGMVLIEETSGEDVTRWTLARGLYYVEMTRIVAGREVSERGYAISFPVDANDLPLPDGPGVWEVESKLTLPPDPPIRQKERYRFGSAIDLPVGDCTYRAIRVDSETWLSGDYTTLSLHYLPDLGTSLFLNVDGSPDVDVIGIEAD